MKETNDNDGALANAACPDPHTTNELNESINCKLDLCEQQANEAGLSVSDWLVKTQKLQHATIFERISRRAGILDPYAVMNEVEANCTVSPKRIVGGYVIGKDDYIDSLQESERLALSKGRSRKRKKDAIDFEFSESGKLHSEMPV